MQLSKKQLKNLIDVISSDDTRPALTHLAVTKIGEGIYLTATDGYHLAALRVSNDWEPYLEKGGIPRAELVKWYKLATAKDVLTEQELFTMITEMDKPFPPIADIADNLRGTITKIGLNMVYCLRMQELAGHPLQWTFGTSHLSPAIARDDGNIYIVMPVKG